MPSLLEHQSADFVKLLLIGESGTGKTGALASLALAGYNLYILDFDNGLDILVQLLKHDKGALARVHFETLTDTMIPGIRGPVPKKAEAFAKSLKILSSWPDKGPLEKWTDKDVLVVDSLTLMGRAAMFFAKSLDNKLFDNDVAMTGGGVEGSKYVL